MTPRFTVEVDRRCQRGLHWRYRCPDMGATEATLFRDAVTARWGSSLEVQSEQWGDQTIHRYVLPFRFELRLGYAPSEFSFIHRVSVTPDGRIADRRSLECLLEDTLR